MSYCEGSEWSAVYGRDRVVIIYPPVIPETTFSPLARARIGATTPSFLRFSAIVRGRHRREGPITNTDTEPSARPFRVKVNADEAYQ